MAQPKPVLGDQSTMHPSESDKAAQHLRRELVRRQIGKEMFAYAKRAVQPQMISVGSKVELCKEQESGVEKVEAEVGRRQQRRDMQELKRSRSKLWVYFRREG